MAKTKSKINAGKVTSRTIEPILIYLYGRQLKSQEALNFIKKVDSCILENVINKSPKAIYTVPKEDVWKYINLIPRYKEFLERRRIHNYQELEVQADIHYVMYYYD